MLKLSPGLLTTCERKREKKREKGRKRGSETEKKRKKRKEKERKGKTQLQTHYQQRTTLKQVPRGSDDKEGGQRHLPLPLPRLPHPYRVPEMRNEEGDNASASANPPEERKNGAQSTNKRVSSTPARK